MNDLKEWMLRFGLVYPRIVSLAGEDEDMDKLIRVLHVIVPGMLVKDESPCLYETDITFTTLEAVSRFIEDGDLDIDQETADEIKALVADKFFDVCCNRF